MTTIPTARPFAPTPARLAPVVVMVVAVVLAGPVALAGLAGSVLPGSCASAAGVHAGLVVDFGDVDTGSPRPADTADCVADPGANGVTLLAKRFGKERIRINGTGLICAIDGYPADGCGDHLPNGKYRYWSYWKGGSSWEYASVGPAGRSISDGSVDGWHFVDGSATPSDGAPANSSPTGPCASAPPTTPPSTGSPSGGGSGGSGGPGGGNQVTPTSSDGAAGGPSAGADPSSGDPTATDPTAAAGGPGGSSDGATGTTGGGADNLSGAENASDVSVGGTSSGGGAPLVLIGVALAVVALGGGAVMRFRSKADE